MRNGAGAGVGATCPGLAVVAVVPSGLVVLRGGGGLAVAVWSRCCWNRRPPRPVPACDPRHPSTAAGCRGRHQGDGDPGSGRRRLCFPVVVTTVVFPAVRLRLPATVKEEVPEMWVRRPLVRDLGQSGGGVGPGEVPTPRRSHGGGTTVERLVKLAVPRGGDDLRPQRGTATVWLGRCGCDVGHRGQGGPVGGDGAAEVASTRRFPPLTGGPRRIVTLAAEVVAPALRWRSG